MSGRDSATKSMDNIRRKMQTMKVVRIYKQVWSTIRCVLSTFFSTINMDVWTDQLAYLPIEMQFYISVMFLGLPYVIHDEKPSFLQFKKNA